MLIDSHCHLDLVENTTPDVLIDTAKSHGVSHFLSVSIDFEHLPHLLTISEQFDEVFASVGIHPNTTCETEATVEELVSFADHPKVIAIGETGLDYYRSEGDLTWQHERFRTHIEAAKQTQKPLIVHTREAKADTLQTLKSENARDVSGIMHCFVEDWETAKKAMDMNFYISFSGIVTFKNAKVLHEVAKKMPLDYMLVETDSPYLAPVPYRGKTNQPAYVKYVAESIAKLRGDSVETIATATTDNFARLFNVNVQ